MYMKYQIPSDKTFIDVINAWLSFENSNYTRAESLKTTCEFSDDVLSAIKSEFIEAMVYKEQQNEQTVKQC